MLKVAEYLGIQKEFLVRGVSKRSYIYRSIYPLAGSTVVYLPRHPHWNFTKTSSPMKSYRLYMITAEHPTIGTHRRIGCMLQSGVG